MNMRGAGLRAGLRARLLLTQWQALLAGPVLLPSEFCGKSGPLHPAVHGLCEKSRIYPAVTAGLVADAAWFSTR